MNDAARSCINDLGLLQEKTGLPDASEMMRTQAKWFGVTLNEDALGGMLVLVSMLRVIATKHPDERVKRTAGAFYGHLGTGLAELDRERLRREGGR